MGLYLVSIRSLYGWRYEGRKGGGSGEGGVTRPKMMPTLASCLLPPVNDWCVRSLPLLVLKHHPFLENSFCHIVFTVNTACLRLVFDYGPFLGKVFSEPEACIEETIGSILFKSIQSFFSLLILHFMYYVDDCLLLLLF